MKSSADNLTMKVKLNVLCKAVCALTVCSVHLNIKTKEAGKWLIYFEVVLLNANSINDIDIDILTFTGHKA